MSAIQLVSTELEKSGWESEELLNKAQILMNQGMSHVAA